VFNVHKPILYWAFYDGLVVHNSTIHFFKKRKIYRLIYYGLKSCILVTVDYLFVYKEVSVIN
jgi:hypothetical protein